ncbi:MAG: HIG1 domain-containing protein [Betaproteobacteria bacterium]|nr:HIG1 domain-containing protein [Betaproteobacteria bacterium]
MTMLAMIAFAVTVLALLMGLGSMAQGGAYDETHASRFMMLRVVAQGAAIAFLLLAMLSVGR